MPDSTPCQTQIRKADADSIRLAAELLRGGQIAAIPTETVYGLAADAANGEAVARIYAAKGRPAFNPLIVHVGGLAMALRYAEFPPLAMKLVGAFWRGPLTLVLPLREKAPLSPLVTAGLPTIAIRAPSHPVMLRLIKELGRGVAAPSANASGRLSPTRAEHVQQSLDGRIPLILDGGATSAGIESTIVAISPDDDARILRLGAIAPEAIDAIAGRPVPRPAEMDQPDATIQAPGMTLRHYAPRLPIRLNAETAQADEYHIGFGAITGDINLSESGDSIEAAARLFALLHQADASQKRAIAVAPIADDGLGAAINDRLRRAASSQSDQPHSTPPPT